MLDEATAMTADTPAAPGVTKEVEDAITAYGECKHDDYFKWIAMKRDAKIALLAAIEKHVSDALAASRAENATLQAELAMATDAANKGDDARTKAGAMQDQISDLRNIIAGMFWAGGSIDDKTVGDIRALGLDCRAENAALAKLIEIAKCPNCDGSGVIVVETTGTEPGCCGHPNRDGSCCGNAIPVQTREQEQQPCQWCDERAQALRAENERRMDILSRSEAHVVRLAARIAELEARLAEAKKENERLRLWVFGPLPAAPNKAGK